MNDSVLVLCRDPRLLEELTRELSDAYQLLSCETTEALHKLQRETHAKAVIVHLHRDTLEGSSPGRFIAELDECVEDGPLLGLLDETTPPRLRKLATKALDDCLELPLDMNRLRRLLQNTPDLQGELEGFWQDLPHKELQGRTRSLTTFTPEMFETLDEIKVAARHNVTALLIGETGSGKTFLAKLIHEISDRRDERLCTVACGALPPDLIESELFGHVKGAFTGADREREGKFAATGRGTLLLDEIDVLPPEQQAKLLRVIETGEYEPVGCNETRYSQARLIVASNYNLEELVQAGTFRTDLYYRLNILCFRLLPLRQRPWDIEYLVRKFALEHSQAHGIQLRGIDPAFIETLRAYHWPGNIREMENVIRRAVLYCQRGILTVNDLPSTIRAAGSGMSIDPPAVMEPTIVERGPQSQQIGRPAIPRMMPGNVLPRTTHTPMAHQITGHAANMPTLPGMSGVGVATMAPPMMSTGTATATLADRKANATLEARVDVLERRIIEDCLQRNNYRRKETAAELGISRVTLYNKMKKFGLL